MHLLVAGDFAVRVNRFNKRIVLEHDFSSVAHQHGDFRFRKKSAQEFECRSQQENAADMAGANGKDSPHSDQGHQNFIVIQIIHAALLPRSCWWVQLDRRALPGARH